MLPKLISTALLTVAITFALVQRATTEPNYAYKIYNPNNLSELSNNVSKAQNDSQIIFIVDFSNSMNEPISGVAKVDIARATLAEILPKIPPTVKTGLRVYGHRAGFTYVQGCRASDLVVPLAPNNCNTILGSLYATRATGWTPITYSLKQTIANGDNLCSNFISFVSLL